MSLATLTPASGAAATPAFPLRKSSLVLALDAEAARHRRLRVALPALRRAAPSRGAVIDALGAADLSDWDPDCRALSRFPAL